MIELKKLKKKKKLSTKNFIIPSQRKKMVASLWTQILVLSKKHAILTVRNWKGTIGQLAAPIGVILMLWIFQLMSNQILSQSDQVMLFETC
jgi:hypothetical protein